MLVWKKCPVYTGQWVGRYLQKSQKEMPLAWQDWFQLLKVFIYYLLEIKTQFDWVKFLYFEKTFFGMKYEF